MTNEQALQLVNGDKLYRVVCDGSDAPRMREFEFLSHREEWVDRRQYVRLYVKWDEHKSRYGSSGDMKGGADDFHLTKKDARADYVRFCKGEVVKAQDAVRKTKERLAVAMRLR